MSGDMEFVIAFGILAALAIMYEFSKNKEDDQQNKDNKDNKDKKEKKDLNVVKQ